MKDVHVRASARNNVVILVRANPAIVIREVRVAPGLVCSCGRAVQPSDPTVVGDDMLRAVCGGCHRDLLEVVIAIEDEDDVP